MNVKGCTLNDATLQKISSAIAKNCGSIQVSRCAFCLKFCPCLQLLCTRVSLTILLQTLIVNASFNDPASHGSVSGVGAASVVAAAASCGVTSFAFNTFGNTDINSSITDIGTELRNLKNVQHFELQMGVVNVVDEAADDAFAADFGAAVASMRDSLAFVSIVMDANQMSVAGRTAMGAGSSACHLKNHAHVACLTPLRAHCRLRTCLPQEHQQQHHQYSGLRPARGRPAALHSSRRFARRHPS